ncbi:acyl carrier protein [Burkholderia cepacia]|uniref:acyl carrier protein n=1 Tax=Burkholderia cepacia TaxID=292 RepID=UPI002AB6AF47|nr:phosphopantetheine-binding protein [Burkholderia cepacia]
MDTINKIINEISETEIDFELTDEIKLADDLHFDSLKYIDLLVFLESETGISISEEEMTQIKTIGDLRNLLQAKA